MKWRGINIVSKRLTVLFLIAAILLQGFVFDTKKVQAANTTYLDKLDTCEIEIINKTLYTPNVLPLSEWSYRLRSVSFGSNNKTLTFIIERVDPNKNNQVQQSYEIVFTYINKTDANSTKEKNTYIYYYRHTKDNQSVDLSVKIVELTSNGTKGFSFIQPPKQYQSNDVTDPFTVFVNLMLKAGTSGTGTGSILDALKVQCSVTESGKNRFGDSVEGNLKDKGDSAPTIFIAKDSARKREDLTFQLTTVGLWRGAGAINNNNFYFTYSSGGGSDSAYFKQYAVKISQDGSGEIITNPNITNKGQFNQTEDKKIATFKFITSSSNMSWLSLINKTYNGYDESQKKCSLTTIHGQNANYGSTKDLSPSCINTSDKGSLAVWKVSVMTETQSTSSTEVEEKADECGTLGTSVSKSLTRVIALGFCSLGLITNNLATNFVNWAAGLFAKVVGTEIDSVSTSTSSANTSTTSTSSSSGNSR